MCASVTKKVQGELIHTQFHDLILGLQTYIVLIDNPAICSLASSFLVFIDWMAAFTWSP